MGWKCSSSVFLLIVLSSGLMVHHKLKPYFWHYIQFHCNWFKIIFIEGQLEVCSFYTEDCGKIYFDFKRHSKDLVLKYRGAYWNDVGLLLWQEIPVWVLLFCSVLFLKWTADLWESVDNKIWCIKLLFCVCFKTD